VCSLDGSTAPCRAGYFIPLANTGACVPTFKDDAVGKCSIGGGPGASCDPEGPTAPCRAGTVCDSTTKKCKRMPITGEACVFDAENPDAAQFRAIDACLSIGYCKQAGGDPAGAGTCARFAKIGEQCGADTEAPFTLSRLCDGNSLRCVRPSGSPTGTCGGQSGGFACTQAADCFAGCGEDNLCKPITICNGGAGG
jgi:hypothetical protein